VKNWILPSGAHTGCVKLGVYDTGGAPGEHTRVQELQASGLNITGGWDPSTDERTKYTRYWHKPSTVFTTEGNQN
ncbi:unnamed protein product, partial [marine sediment metagenome]